MIAEVQQALRVQDLDLRIQQLTGQIAELPKQIRALEKQLEAHQHELALQRAKLAANRQEHKQLELDVTAHQQKISKLRDQMLLAKTNEQYRAFQHEIEFCENRIREAEDRILELMSAAEELEVQVQQAEAALAKEQLEVEARKSAARRQTDANRQALAEAEQQRVATFAALPKTVQMQYARLKKKYPHSLVVVEVVEGVCQGCRLHLRPQLFQDLRNAREIMTCEHCGRIIYYHPPVDQQAQFEGGVRVSLS